MVFRSIEAPQISHLLFADDCIIFGKANVGEGNRVLKVLADYEKESGQKLNKEKTSLFFSRNTGKERRKSKGTLGLRLSTSTKGTWGCLP